MIGAFYSLRFIDNGFVFTYYSYVTGKERKEAIVKELHEEGRVLVTTLAERFQVTRVTIRKDLESLENRGVLERTHGGAVPAERPGYLRLISETIHENAEKKEKIASLAVKLVQPYTTLLIDSGSTTGFLARKIKDMYLTVFTNSVLVLQELSGSESIELIVTGGALRRPSMALMGEAARLLLSRLHSDIMFLGATAYHHEHGISCTNLIEAETKRAMIKSASRVCLVADSTKMGKISTALVCGWEDIDIFVTDSISREDKRRLTACGVEIYTDSYF